MVSGRFPHARHSPPAPEGHSLATWNGVLGRHRAPHLLPSAPTPSQDTVLIPQDPLRSPILRSAAGCAPDTLPGSPEPGPSHRPRPQCPARRLQVYHMSASPWPIPARPRGSPCETGMWQHLPSGAAAGVSSRAWGQDRPGVWRRVERQLSLPRPRSVRLSARRGLAGAWGPLSARPPSSSHGRRRPPRRRSRTSPGSQSGRLATAGLLATAVFPEQGGGTQCIMGQGDVTFRLALGPPPQPHSQTF